MREPPEVGDAYTVVRIVLTDRTVAVSMNAGHWSVTGDEWLQIDVTAQSNAVAMCPMSTLAWWQRI